MYRTLVILTCACLVALYLSLSWVGAFALRPSLVSNTIDVSQEGMFRWSLNARDLESISSRAILSMVFEPELLADPPSSRREVSLRVRIAILSPNLASGKGSTLRSDHYYSTDEPLGPEGENLWERYAPGEIEYGLAGLTIERDQNLCVELTVLTPDSKLAKARPRLRLASEEDYAGASLRRLARLASRDIGFVLAVISLSVIVLLALRRRSARGSSS